MGLGDYEEEELEKTLTRPVEHYTERPRVPSWQEELAALRGEFEAQKKATTYAILILGAAFVFASLTRVF